MLYADRPIPLGRHTAPYSARLIRLIVRMS